MTEIPLEIVAILAFVAYGGCIGVNAHEDDQCYGCGALEDWTDEQRVHHAMMLYHDHRLHSKDCPHLVARRLYAHYLWEQRQEKEKANVG